MCSIGAGSARKSALKLAKRVGLPLAGWGTLEDAHLLSDPGHGRYSICNICNPLEHANKFQTCSSAAGPDKQRRQEKSKEEWVQTTISFSLSVSFGIRRGFAVD